jgi:hypothetical protein
MRLHNKLAYMTKSGRGEEAAGISIVALIT